MRPSLGRWSLLLSIIFFPWFTEEGTAVLGIPVTRTLLIPDPSHPTAVSVVGVGADGVTTFILMEPGGDLVTAQANADVYIQTFDNSQTDSCNYADISGGKLNCFLIFDPGNGGVATVTDGNGPFPVHPLQYVAQVTTSTSQSPNSPPQSPTSPSSTADSSPQTSSPTDSSSLTGASSAATSVSNTGKTSGSTATQTQQESSIDPGSPASSNPSGSGSGSGSSSGSADAEGEPTSTAAATGAQKSNHTGVAVGAAIGVIVLIILLILLLLFCRRRRQRQTHSFVKEISPESLPPPTETREAMRNGAIIPFTEPALVDSAPQTQSSSRGGYSKAAEAAAESRLASAGVNSDGAGSSAAATGGHGHASTLSYSASTSAPSNVGTDDSITPSASASQAPNTELLTEMRRLRERVADLESRTNVHEAPPGYQESE